MDKFKDSIEYMKNVYRFQEKMGEQNIVLTYQGEITQDIITALTDLTETNLERTKEDETIIARVYQLMIECLQNIVKHSDDLKEGHFLKQRSGIFLGEFEDEYIITTGNVIFNSKIETLKTQLDLLNNMNEDELDSLYMEQIVTGHVSDKGGAGLGFIEMARKTHRKLEYYFEPMNDETSYLLLNLIINKKV